MIDRVVKLPSNINRSSCDKRQEKLEQNCSYCSRVTDEDHCLNDHEPLYSKRNHNYSMVECSFLHEITPMSLSTTKEQELASDSTAASMQTRINSSLRMTSKRLIKMNTPDSNNDIENTKISTDVPSFTADIHNFNKNCRISNNNYDVHNNSDDTNSTNAVTIFVIKTVLPDD